MIKYQILAILTIILVFPLFLIQPKPFFDDYIFEESFLQKILKGEISEGFLKSTFNTISRFETYKVQALPKQKRYQLLDITNIISRAIPAVSVDELPYGSENKQVAAVGLFAGTDLLHKAVGKVTVYEREESGSQLRLEDFSITNGPALEIFLSSNADGSLGDGQFKVGLLKGNEGNQNYFLPPEVEISQYKSVAIYSKPLSLLYAYAPLQ